MITTHLLRILSILGFLLLFAPFYDSCNGKRMKKADANAEAVADSVIVDSIGNEQIELAKTNKVISNEHEMDVKPFYILLYGYIDDEDSENAFELAKLNTDVIFKFDFKEFKDGIKESGTGFIFFHFKNLCFSFIVLFMSLIFVLSFSKKVNWIYSLSIINLFLLVISLVCLFLEATFEHIRQIKWGYYAFIMVSIVIYIKSRAYIKAQSIV